ncbi:MAG: UbiA family prenyltransferase [Phycisphaeraceae bacterium]|nr:UbiA family prenyltransferase [Phycisphaeraceae bacterium]
MSALRVIADDIKIAHSIFALPFAVLAAAMAAFAAGDGRIDWTDFAGQLVLVVIAMVFARTAAMLANRILDRRIDAENPRTVGRAIPSGRLSTRSAVVAFLISSIAFVLIAALFGVFYGNWWPVILAVPVLGWITAYGLFKRFTWMCHLWLGASLALSPVASAIAVDPAFLASPPIWLLAGMVLCWVAGFDMIYALQDVTVDRAEGLHSMPSRLGVSGALWLSCVLHVVAVTLLTLVWWMDPRLGWVFLIGVVAVTALLVVEHATVHKWGTSRMAVTFFTLNGVVSCLLGITGIVDILV